MSGILPSMKEKIEVRNLKLESRRKYKKDLFTRFKIKNFTSFLKQYYFLIIFLGCIGFVGMVSAYKLFIAKPTYVYAKVKVGQGMWWATTQRPSLWFVKAIQHAKEQKDLTGKPVVKLLDTTYYPYFGSGQYDVYVTVQLKVSKVGNKGTYNFNRETIGVSSPIDLEFPTVQFSGTIIELSDVPFHDKLVKKTVYLSKKYTYPWEFEEVKIGDTFNNGKQTVLTITDKSKGDTNEVLINDMGKLSASNVETYRYIILQTEMLLKQSGSQLIYGEETLISPGRGFGIATDRATLNDYVISKIE